jgi:hypothetical protein
MAQSAGICSIERITGVHRDNIMRLGIRIERGGEMLMDSKMQDLGCRYLQFGELWGSAGRVVAFSRSTWLVETLRLRLHCISLTTIS